MSTPAQKRDTRHKAFGHSRVFQDCLNRYPELIPTTWYVAHAGTFEEATVVAGRKAWFNGIGPSWKTNIGPLELLIEMFVKFEKPIGGTPADEAYSALLKRLGRCVSDLVVQEKIESIGKPSLAVLKSHPEISYSVGVHLAEAAYETSHSQSKESVAVILSPRSAQLFDLRQLYRGVVDGTAAVGETHETVREALKNLAKQVVLTTQQTTQRSRGNGA